MESIKVAGVLSKVVIVIEDEPLIRSLVVEVLAESFVVLEACDAAKALELLSARAADISVMFTDIHMPGAMNGLQLAHHVHDNWPWIKLLIASGKERPAVTAMPVSSRFMSKPYNHTLMMRHVQELASDFIH